MYKNPSLLDKILGRGPKGIIPLKQQLQKLGISPTYKKGNKVRFRFFGEDIRPEFRFNFKDGESYIGRFSKQDVIKRTADDGKQSMYLKMGEKLGEDEYNVDVVYDKVVDGKSDPHTIGKGKIKITDRNF